VIWAKTDAGRLEMRARALVKERAARNLLLVIDGTKSDDMLLTSLAGITRQDFTALQSLGLIEPAGTVRNGHHAAAPPVLAAAGAPIEAEDAPAQAGEPLDYAQFTARLTQIISKELGLRGFMLTLAVEKASTIEELQDVARRTLDTVRDRKGAAAADASRRRLYGA
jgi:hypothetical protein